MTKKEAKNKWCPFVRHVANNGGVFSNKPSAMIHDVCCIASDCMAWRDLFIKDESSPSGLSKNGGYCGLAGNP